METFTPTPTPPTAHDTYEQTAPHYDRLTAHHDYELWIGNLLGALNAHGLTGNRLLDVACGTGKSFLPMLDRGWEATAVDLSPAMIERAREKAGDRAHLVVGDMRALPDLGGFDLVWCLDDSLNYLLTEEELDLALVGLARNVHRGGLCLFDVNTLAMYRGFFATESRIEDAEGRLIVRGHTSPDFAPGQMATASVEVLDPAPAQPIRITHAQRHFPPDRVVAAIERAGLRCLGIYGHGYDAVLRQPLDEAVHTKAVFIAGKEERR